MSKFIFIFIFLPIFHTDGVEHCWAVCKRKYRAKIANLRVGQIPFSNLAVVRQCIEELDHDLCSRIAINGWARLMAAEPV